MTTKEMDKYLLQQLNYIKMCQSDKAIMNRIESIYSDGKQVGWNQSEV